MNFCELKLGIQNHLLNVFWNISGLFYPLLDAFVCQLVVGHIVFPRSLA